MIRFINDIVVNSFNDNIETLKKITIENQNKPKNNKVKTAIKQIGTAGVIGGLLYANHRHNKFLNTLNNVTKKGVKETYDFYNKAHPLAQKYTSYLFKNGTKNIKDPVLKRQNKQFILKLKKHHFNQSEKGILTEKIKSVKNRPDWNDSQKQKVIEKITKKYNTPNAQNYKQPFR